jgi:hypothetical protein
MSDRDQDAAGDELTEFVCYGRFRPSEPAPPADIPDDDSALTEFIVTAPVWRTPANESNRKLFSGGK